MLVRATLLDLQESEIGPLIGSDDGCRHGLAIVQGHGDLGGVLDDMIVRDNIAIGRDNESRALCLRNMRFEVMAAFLLAKMFEEALERVARRNMRRLAFLAGTGRLGGLHLDGHDRALRRKASWIVRLMSEGSTRGMILISFNANRKWHIMR
jgi:hypothetical protein